MFRQITLRNYRTHRNTTINLGPVTLLIGNNNSGKSNLLAGIRHFAQLVARARPPQVDQEQAHDSAQGAGSEIPDPRQVREADFFDHRHRLASEEEPMAFSCHWESAVGEVKYSIELYEDFHLADNVGVRERIEVRLTEGANGMPPEWHQCATGRDTPTDSLALRTLLRDGSVSVFSKKEYRLCEAFFGDLSHVCAYHFQPSYLKGMAKTSGPIVDPEKPVVPSQLGYEGGNLQALLSHYRSSDERAFQQFIASLRRFDSTFHGIRKDEEERLICEFDLGRDTPGRLDEFLPDVISDGFLKAAAIALLTTARHSPPLILIEEIENGVNPANIQEFMSWLWQAAGEPGASTQRCKPQFVLTSHSPAVLREFVDNLENVYTVRLERHGFKSDVRNLAEALDTLIGIGTIDGEIVESDGRKAVKIPRSELSELWYSGTIG